MTDMARWSVRWGNPTTQPPDGRPRILAAVLVGCGQPVPAEITDLHRAEGYGSGWCIARELVSQQPIRRWSREAKARVRQRNLRRRMEMKFPLFAEDFIAAELAARPDYFAAGDAAEVGA